MKRLLSKEFRLAIHPTVIIFWCLSFMLLIPNYPYYVVFFYSALALFFVCLTGRENHDIEYTMAFPVRKRDVVKARISFAVLCELIQMTAAVPFALLRQRMPLPGNQVGMDANLAFFGLALMMLGLHNLVFFTLYYAGPAKVGRAFVASSAVMFFFMAVAETLTHVLPFLRDRLDTPDPLYLPEKFATLAAGAAVFTILTLRSCRISVKQFEKLDL